MAYLLEEIVERFLRARGAGRSRRGRRFAFDDSGHPIQPATLLAEFENDSVRTLVTEALAEARTIPKIEQQVADLAVCLRNQSIDKELAELRQALGHPDLSPEDNARIVHEMTALRSAKRAPLISPV